ncbi:MAG TPA: SRPBCC family protein [Xanthobacteraceae bacterium]|jgi:phenylpropionate dioxygenase-like ring-hydroxylating dioxygenase large terminal subunit|nr:SRPBCC family protein [Xanthobacteraceae bacterium]
MPDLRSLIDQKHWLIGDQVFAQDIYQRELETVFGRCWLFVGHDSMVPKPHDYFTHFMGETGVIVQRDGAGRIRGYLNKCRHRGNIVCPYDRGNAKNFSCAYHGWVYSDGKLIGVPHSDEAYAGGINFDEWGLVEIPKLQSWGGLIFGCWDPDAISLDDYLGDARWYLEHFLLREKLGGLEVIPGVQRYMVPTNWKIVSENLAGDHYHFMVTHGGFVEALRKSEDKRIALTGVSTGGRFHAFSVALNHDHGVPHGIFQLRSGSGQLETDLTAAEELGPEAVAWVHERQRVLEEELKDFKHKPYSFQGGNIFPNLGLTGVGSALYGKAFMLHHPRGADRTEVWTWCAVEKNAPAAVKERARFVLMQRFAATGMVVSDDSAIFERIAENLNTPPSRQWPMHYAMAMAQEGEDPRPAALAGEPQRWPGLLTQTFQETAQRDFYRYWSELMNTNPAPAN